MLEQLQHDQYLIVVNLNYERVQPSDKLTGKIYGPEPLAQLTLDLQLYYSYQSIVPLMPEVVRERLGTQAQFEELVGVEEEADE